MQGGRAGVFMRSLISSNLLVTPTGHACRSHPAGHLLVTACQSRLLVTPYRSHLLVTLVSHTLPVTIASHTLLVTLADLTLSVTLAGHMLRPPHPSGHTLCAGSSLSQVNRLLGNCFHLQQLAMTSVITSPGINQVGLPTHAGYTLATAWLCSI